MISHSILILMKLPSRQTRRFWIICILRRLCRPHKWKMTTNGSLLPTHPNSVLTKKHFLVNEDMRLTYYFGNKKETFCRIQDITSEMLETIWSSRCLRTLIDPRFSKRPPRNTSTCCIFYASHVAEKVSSFFRARSGLTGLSSLRV